MLVGLSPADRRAVLLELLAEDQINEVSAAPVSNAAAPARVFTKYRKGKGRHPATQVRPTEGATTGKTDTLIAVLTEHPRLAIRDLSKRVYGDDAQDNQDRTRSLLAALKRSGRAMNFGPGEWEVVTKGS